MQVARFRASNDARYIERITITGPPNSICVLYVGSVANENRRDASSSGAGDTAEYPTGVFVPGGNDVFLVWNVNTPQAQGTIQWRV